MSTAVIREGDDAIGKLVHDLRSNNPDDMYDEELDAERAEAAAKSNENARKDNALTMLKDGKPDLDDIARYSVLSIDQVKQLKSSFKN